MLDLPDIEAIAAELYELARADMGDPPGAVALARTLFGADGIQRVDWRIIHGPAVLVRIDGQPRIYVGRGLTAAELAFSVSHELGHWMCDRLGCGDDPDLEQICDATGAAIVLPRRAFRAALGVLGNLDALARAFVTTESCAALRMGETTGRPLCLLAPTRVRIRGDAYGWPTSEPELRRLAKVRRPGLRKARLGDDPRRTLIVADEETG